MYWQINKIWYSQVDWFENNFINFRLVSGFREARSLSQRQSALGGFYFERISMKLSKEFIESIDPCEGGREWFEENGMYDKETVVVIEKLIEQNYLSEANWLIVRTMSYRQYVSTCRYISSRPATWPHRYLISHHLSRHGNYISLYWDIRTNSQIPWLFASVRTCRPNTCSTFPYRLDNLLMPSLFPPK